MLISSDLSNLGSALRSASPNMQTKGVASHRAPVSTLNAHRVGVEITHDAFVAAVQQQFAAVYGGAQAVVVSEEEAPKAVWEGVEDLKVSCTKE
jgi:lipoate-protein ligase A